MWSNWFRNYLRRKKRQRIVKSFGDDFTVYLMDNTPTSIAEAYASSDADDWKEAVQSEMGHGSSLNDLMVASQ